uniref:Uncharacterized protein n=1 Tax=Vespula pensylvanica TaxID=30213 RepID=A0A834UBL0_VESPE|nr:hypothetical protein H0235_005774 [Vespula pensylvanica]
MEDRNDTYDMREKPNGRFLARFPIITLHAKEFERKACRKPEAFFRRLTLQEVSHLYLSRYKSSTLATAVSRVPMYLHSRLSNVLPARFQGKSIGIFVGESRASRKVETLGVGIINWQDKMIKQSIRMRLKSTSKGNDPSTRCDLEKNSEESI